MAKRVTAKPDVMYRDGTQDIKQVQNSVFVIKVFLCLFAGFGALMTYSLQNVKSSIRDLDPVEKTYEALRRSENFRHDNMMADIEACRKERKVLLESGTAYACVSKEQEPMYRHMLGMDKEDFMLPGWAPAGPSGPSTKQ